MYTISSDGGDSWGPLMFDDALGITPTVQASILKRLPNSTDVFLSGPTVGRTHMVVRRSSDDAATWNQALKVYAGPSAYSCLSDLPGSADEMGLLFEHDGEECIAGSGASCKIVFVRFPYEFKDALGLSAERSSDVLV